MSVNSTEHLLCPQINATTNQIDFNSYLDRLSDKIIKVSMYLEDVICLSQQFRIDALVEDAFSALQGDIDKKKAVATLLLEKVAVDNVENNNMKQKA
mmetsp:Transcript_36820/g.92538  ORF Transcript_36820/g.92538 Transcript_36820/m.92538 type:complete len:97 (+) Transcript_36820:1-291(+)